MKNIKISEKLYIKKKKTEITRVSQFINKFNKGFARAPYSSPPTYTVDGQIIILK